MTNDPNRYPIYPQMMARIVHAHPMVNMLLLEFYYCVAQMGLGMAGVPYDLSPLERGALRARGQ